MPHPFVALLAERPIRVLWSGLAVSATGSELYRVGAVWLAVGLAGGDAAFLVAAQSAATLAAALLGGAIADLLPRRTLIVAANLVSCAVAGSVVAFALVHGLTLPVLVAASVLLAAVAGLVSPALTSGVPLLVPDPDRLRAANGLFDATTRTAQVAGPFLAAAWVAVAPAIHLLSLNAASFLAAAGAVAAVGTRLDGDPGQRPARPARVLARLARGAAAASCCPGTWTILLATAVRGAAMGLGFTLGVPLLLSGIGDHGPQALAGVALLLGGYAAGELLGSIAVVLWKPADPWRALFLGYAAIGTGLALLPVPLLLLDPAPAVLLSTVIAFAGGLGGAAAGVQMLSFLGGRLAADDFAAVLRLRLALVIGATMLAAAVGPWLFAALGVPATMTLAGAAATAAALAGLARNPEPRRERPAGGIRRGVERHRRP